MEYWVVYDLASGEERWRGSGAIGTAAQQPLPEGMGMALVPGEALRGAVVDLAVLREAASAMIDAEAERVRLRFLTGGSGQAMTYTRKEAEARAYVAGTTDVVPFLSAEAAARGLTLADLATEVIALADAWTAIGSAIEGVRMGAKAKVARAGTLGAIVEAGRVNWSVIDAPAA